jgi:hypothetical protein
VQILADATLKNKKAGVPAKVGDREQAVIGIEIPKLRSVEVMLQLH